MLMKVGEYNSSKSETGFSPVSIDPYVKELESCKAFMSKATTVQMWNKLRTFAKELFPPEVVSKLDASGYIKTLKLKNEANG